MKRRQNTFSTQIRRNILSGQNAPLLYPFVGGLLHTDRQIGQFWVKSQYLKITVKYWMQQNGLQRLPEGASKTVSAHVHSHSCMEKKAHCRNQPSVTVTSQSKSCWQPKRVRHEVVQFGGRFDLQAKPWGSRAYETLETTNRSKLPYTETTYRSKLTYMAARHTSKLPQVPVDSIFSNTSAITSDLTSICLQICFVLNWSWVCRAHSNCFDRTHNYEADVEKANDFRLYRFRTLREQFLGCTLLNQTYYGFCGN
jgi:hypothetical protein